MAYKIYTYADPYRIRETDFWNGDVDHIKDYPQLCASRTLVNGLISVQVIAKLARHVYNLETKQGRIRAEHEFWNDKWITGHFRRTLISYGLYKSGKS